MQQVNIPLEKLLKASDGSIYGLVILVAKRAIELDDGTKAMVESPVERALDNALREIEASKIKIKK